MNQLAQVMIRKQQGVKFENEIHDRSKVGDKPEAEKRALLLSYVGTGYPDSKSSKRVTVIRRRKLYK